MLWHIVIAAFRNLERNKFHAGINIIGLAAGFCAAILIGLFVRDEFSYDRWIPGHARVHLIGISLSREFFTGPSDLAGWIKHDLPDVQDTARVWSAPGSLRHGQVEAPETVFWADPNIFSLLQYPVIAGDLGTALKRPDGIVITQKVARKYFGRDAPLGETIELDRKHLFRVTAVLADFPSNSNNHFDIVLPGQVAFSPLTESDAVPIVNFGGKLWNAFTFVQLTPHASAEAVAKALPDVLDRHAPSVNGPKTSKTFKLELVPLADLHLHAPASLAMVYSIAGVGVLIVFIAGINFVNLMTAVAARRMVEVGVRKASGARRLDLIVQFIGETLIYVAISMLLAIVLVELLIPYFNAFLNRTIAFEYWRDPALMAAIALCTLVIGIAGGCYPAFVLSAFRPASVLRGSLMAGPSDRGMVRQSLVMLQFAVLIGLVVTTGVIYRQTVYAMNREMQSGTDQLIQIRTRCETSFRDEVKKLPGVLGAACAGQSPFTVSFSTGLTLQNGQQKALTYDSVDFGYFGLFGLRPLAGRLFSRDRGMDAGAGGPDPNLHEPVVINETAVRRWGFASPQAAIGQTISWDHFFRPPQRQTGRHTSQIIGVVPDFSLGSVRSAILPTAFYVDPGQFRRLIVKLDGRTLPGVLNAMDRLWARSGDPGPIQRVFLDQAVQDLYLDILRDAELFAVFACVAVFVAGLGMLGLSAFTTERRTKEIGIRKAMGARSGQVMRLLVWDFMKPVLWANLLAWPAAYWAMSRWLSGFAYHIEMQLWMFAAAALFAFLIALLTVSGYVFFTARQKPVFALRYE